MSAMNKQRILKDYHSRQGTVEMRRRRNFPRDPTFLVPISFSRTFGTVIFLDYKILRLSSEPIAATDPLLTHFATLSLLPFVNESGKMALQFSMVQVWRAENNKKGEKEEENARKTARKKRRERNDKASEKAL